MEFELGFCIFFAGGLNVCRRILLKEKLTLLTNVIIVYHKGYHTPPTVYIKDTVMTSQF